MTRSALLLFLQFLFCASIFADATLPAHGIHQILCDSISTVEAVQSETAAIATKVDGTLSLFDPVYEDFSLTEATLIEINAVVEDLAASTERILNTIDQLQNCLQTPYLISSPGVYTLCANSIEQIVIDADFVTLNLNGYTVDGVPNTLSSGIVVNPGKSNIIIYNGFVEGATGAGITINGTSPNPCIGIVVHDVNVNNCDQGIGTAYCANSKIYDCAFEQNRIGLSLAQSDRMIIENCLAQNSLFAGFALLNCTYNNFDGCKAIDTIGQEYAYGFYSEGIRSKGNVFTACYAENTNAASESAQEVVGFMLQPPEMQSSIANCTVNDVGGAPQACGINLPLSSTVVPTTSGDFKGRAVAWSPDGQYLVVGGGDGSNGHLRLYGVTLGSPDNTLVELDAITVGDTIHTVSWTSDGAYFAIGGKKSGLAMVQIYEVTGGNTLTLVYDLFLSLLDHAETVSVDWSSSGLFLAIVGKLTDNNQFVEVYEFDGTNLVLKAEDIPSAGILNSVAWGPYNTDSFSLAIAGRQGNSGVIRIFQFVPSSSSFSEDASKKWSSLFHPSSVNSVSWTSDGTYLAACGDGGEHQTIKIYLWESNKTLSQKVSVDFEDYDSLLAVSWMPNSVCLAVGAHSSISGAVAQIMGFFPGEQEETKLIDLKTLEPSPSGIVYALGWYKHGLRLAVGQENNIGRTYNVVSRCDVQFNKISGVHGFGLYDNNGVNVILNNDSIKNVHNYSEMPLVAQYPDDGSMISNRSFL